MELAGGSNGSYGKWCDGKRMGKGSRGGSQERLVDGDRLRKGLGCERKRGRNGSRKDERLVSQSYWSWNHRGLDQDRRDSKDRSSWDSIAGLDRLGLSPSSL